VTDTDGASRTLLVVRSTSNRTFRLVRNTGLHEGSGALAQSVVSADSPVIAAHVAVLAGNRRGIGVTTDLSDGSHSTKRNGHAQVGFRTRGVRGTSSVGFLGRDVVTNQLEGAEVVASTQNGQFVLGRRSSCNCFVHAPSQTNVQRAIGVNTAQVAVASNSIGSAGTSNGTVAVTIGELTGEAAEVGRRVDHLARHGATNAAQNGCGAIVSSDLTSGQAHSGQSALAKHVGGGCQREGRQVVTAEGDGTEVARQAQQGSTVESAVGSAVTGTSVAVVSTRRASCAGHGEQIGFELEVGLQTATQIFNALETPVAGNRVVGRNAVGTLLSRRTTSGVRINQVSVTSVQTAVQGNGRLGESSAGGSKILTKAEKNADTGATSLPKVLNVPFSTILMYSGVPVLT